MNIGKYLIITILVLAVYASTAQASIWDWFRGSPEVQLGAATSTKVQSLNFSDELLPDGSLCSNGQILKKTGLNDWDCAADDNSGGSGGGSINTSSPITVNHFPFWASSTGLLSGTSTATYNSGAVNVSGTITQNGATIPNLVHATTTYSGEDYLSLSGQDFTGNAIDPDNLSASDFGDFTCDGATCTLDTTYLTTSTGLGTANFSTANISQWTNDVPYVESSTQWQAIVASSHQAVSLAGAPDYITIAGQVITRALINLTSHITGILGISNGGTATSTTPADNAFLLGNGTNYGFSTLPDCISATERPHFNTSTNAWSCVTDLNDAGVSSETSTNPGFYIQGTSTWGWIVQGTTGNLHLTQGTSVPSTASPMIIASSSKQMQITQNNLTDAGAVKYTTSTAFIAQGSTIRTASLTIATSGPFISASVSGSTLTLTSISTTTARTQMGVATSSATFQFYDATSTMPYSLQKTRIKNAGTLRLITCDEYAAATTTIFVYRITAVGTTTNAATFASTTCGVSGTTVTSFTTSTLLKGQYLAVKTTSTAGTPTMTNVNVVWTITH